jgi:hypothetical protein
LRNGQLRWTISDKASVDQCVKETVEAFVAVGIPFFKRYSNIDLVFAQVANDSDEGKLLNRLPDKRAKNALALAALRGGRVSACADSAIFVSAS